ncbi:MAG: hypothetical protein AB1652_10660 [Bacillota bacterium]
MAGAGAWAEAEAREYVRARVVPPVDRERGLAGAARQQEVRVRALFRETASAPSAARRYRTIRGIPAPA